MANFNWSEATVFIAGIETPARAAEATIEREVTMIHESGSPIASSLVRSSGKNFEGKIRITQERLHQIERNLLQSRPPGTQLVDIDFDVVVSYFSGDLLSTKRWVDAAVTSLTEAHGVDTDIPETELSFKIRNIVIVD